MSGDEIDESALIAARDLRAAFGRLRRKLKELDTVEDLTPSQTSVLIRLAVDGPSSTSQLAGAERVRPQSMASILAALEQHRLIQRKPDPADGRRQVITLTAAGEQHAATGSRARKEWLARAMHDRYTERERGVIREALTLLDRLTD